MQRIVLGHIWIDRLKMNEVVDLINMMVSQKKERPAHIVTVNAQFIQIARREPRFADIIRHADLCVADGVSLVWASRLLGNALPERVNGTDLMVELCKTAAANGSTVYFLGGRPGAADHAAQLLRSTFSSLKIVGIDCPSYGFAQDGSLDSEVSNRIELAKPDILFVGLGAPKQEYWIEQHSNLAAKVMIGIGGSFELIAGFVKRAPLFVQKLGCEWLWRLCMEPGRLWKRYLDGNAVFIYIVIRQWMQHWYLGYQNLQERD